MSQSLTLKARGLFTHPNPFSAVPEGALSQAENAVIDRENLVEVRRGFGRYSSAVIGEIDQWIEFRDALFAHNRTTDELKKDNGSGTFSVVGTVIAPSSRVAVKATEANKNLYITSTTGIRKLESPSGSLQDAGMPEGLDGEATVAGASGFLANSANVAYRVVWGITDSNDNLILGSPSQRIIATNSSGGTRDIDITFTIPAGITTSHFYQIYRSPQTALITDEPNDELQLVYEDNPTAGEITAKVIIVTDSTPDELKGAFLYTSPSQEGILQANERPPIARDIVLFKNTVFYLGTKTKHKTLVNLISAGPTDGIQVGDTVTIAGVVYTGAAAENIAANEFQVFTAGTPAENIEDTAKSLVRVVNRSTSTTLVYAYYLSGFEELPGRIMIRERAIGGFSFTFNSSRTTAWTPSLPLTSVNEDLPNRGYFAKSGQPEAVPLLNFFDFGAADEEILRGKALRDSLFVYKDDGIFRILGEDSTSFRVSLFDDTVILTAPESVANMNNQTYIFSEGGIVSVSETGVAIVSRPIENVLLRIAAQTGFESETFGTGYESDKKYILTTLNEDGTERLLFVYNLLTDSWTTWDRSFLAGINFFFDNKLYFSESENEFAYQERKDFDLSDYKDEEFSVTIIAFSGDEVTLSSVTNLEEGMWIKQGAENKTKILDITGFVLTVQNELTWSLGAALVDNPIITTINWLPIDAQNPGVVKRWNNCEIIFNNVSFNSIFLLFESNFTTQSSETELISKSFGGWGEFKWGELAWGGGIEGEQVIPSFVPRDCAWAVWLLPQIRLEEPETTMGLAGLSLFYEVVDNRFR